MSHLHAMYRTSYKVYTARPPANCATARAAWDYHVKKGPVLRLRLLDGYWGAQRETGHWDETENTFAAERSRAAAKGTDGQGGAA